MLLISSLLAVVVFATRMLSALTARPPTLCVPAAVVVSLCCSSILGAAVVWCGVAPGALIGAVVNLALAAALAYACHHLGLAWTPGGLLNTDVAAYAILVAVVALCGFVQFGPGLQINFESTDGAAHFQLSRAILQSGEMGAMYLTHYSTALLLDAFAPLVGPLGLYKAFVVTELAFLWLNGCQFHALLRACLPRASLIVSVSFTLLYLGGYPLLNMVFGFSYLGMGLTVLLSSAFVAACRTEALPRCEWAILVVLLFGVWISYQLFAPLAVLVPCLSALPRTCQPIRRHRLMLALGGVLFGLAALLALRLLTNAGLFVGLQTDGFSYKQLYASFIPVAPFALYGLFALWRPCERREGRVLAVLASICIAAVVFALACFICGMISAYYYYKLYFPLWACAFLCGAAGFLRLMGEAPIYVLGYSSVMLSLFVATVSGVNGKVATRWPELGSVADAESLFGVYAFNEGAMRGGRISEDEVALWQAADNLREHREPLPLVAGNIDVYWYQALTNQWDSNDFRRYHYWMYGEDDWSQTFINRLAESSYLAVLNGQELPSYLQEYLDLGERVYENDAGYIVRLP